MIDYIHISTLNDFVFCPYSIYLHNVYMDTDESLFHATPQTRGRIAHKSIDNKSANNCKDNLISYPVYSAKIGLMGSIILFEVNNVKLKKYGNAIHRDTDIVYF